MTENNQLSVDRLISVLAEILSTEKIKVKIKLTNKKESPCLAVSKAELKSHPGSAQQPPGDGDITEAERLFFEKGYGKEK